MRRLETLQDLIEEVKVRTVCWFICIFGIAYFLSHTSKSIWTNIPIAILILSTFRYLSYEVELRWRARPIRRQTYLSHLEKHQLSLNDSRLSTVFTNSRWKRKIDSPPVEAAIDDFINKILQDFVVDLWYSSITPDKEAPELIRKIILDVLGEISGRIKEANLVDLLTRDMVDLIGNHLDLYRKNQSEIGVDVMGTLSFEERDERLKHHLISSRELHPALISPESEHKVLQRIVGGLLAVVLRRQEAQCPLVRCISRELLTCLVVQPVMNLASPMYINELIEYIFLSSKDNKGGVDRPTNAAAGGHSHSVSVGNTKIKESESGTTFDQSSELALATTDLKLQEYPLQCTQPRAADWALIFEAATKRRTQVLTPENLENMWTKGRNYKRKTENLIKEAKTSSGSARTSAKVDGSTKCIEDYSMAQLINVSNTNNLSEIVANIEPNISQNSIHGGQIVDSFEENVRTSKTNHTKLKRSSSTPDIDTAYRDKDGEATTSREYYEADISKYKEEETTDLISYIERSLYSPKIKCRVVGAYFEKLGSKSFAVYSIAVTDAENKSWFVKRRYRNFERLHRHLKDIPNYTLHLPPKRFLSSSIDDYFVHQRCILLDKYLRDLLSIANVAEQHEVWDFLSASSKNYSFGKSTSVMKTLVVNVDDAMDDIVRQFKGVSDGLMKKVVGTSPSNVFALQISSERSIASTWNEEDIRKLSPDCSDKEVHDGDHSSGQTNGWHSDNELNSKGLPPRVVKRVDESMALDSRRGQLSGNFNGTGLDEFLASDHVVASDHLEDLVGMPPEWTPPNVSVPLLNLVDKIFQLNRRGWLRRQVFWISKQILQLMMEDAIDDWILRQIHWLRKDEVIAQGIHWVQDVLWPNGTFFIKLDSSRVKDNSLNQKPVPFTNKASADEVIRPSSFELQLEAARRASDVKKMILGGAPAPLVGLIGQKQYRRSAKDIYYFLQSTVCVKQLTYSMLELVLITVFPELRDLLLDIHGKDAINRFEKR